MINRPLFKLHQLYGKHKPVHPIAKVPWANECSCGIAISGQGWDKMPTRWAPMSRQLAEALAQVRPDYRYLVPLALTQHQLDKLKAAGVWPGI